MGEEREGGNWRINYDYVIVVGMFTGELSDVCPLS